MLLRTDRCPLDGPAAAGTPTDPTRDGRSVCMPWVPLADIGIGRRFPRRQDRATHFARRVPVTVAHRHRSSVEAGGRGIWGRRGWHNDGMEPRRWLDRSQPQTLQNAVMLCYFNAGFSLLFGLVAGGMGLLLLLPIALGAGGFGIANDRKWGYWLAVVFAGLSLADAVLVFVLLPGFGPILNMLFIGVLFALLLHPMSRHYQKLWFR